MKPVAKKKLVILIDTDNCSPQMLRQRFRKEIRDAVMRAHSDALIELEVAEELIRAIPASEFI